MKDLSKQNMILVLRWTCFFLFLGRSWQHLIWDIPIRSFFWDQYLMEAVISSLTGMTWFEYATSEVQDSIIEQIKWTFGIFYLLCAILSWIVRENRKWAGWILMVGSLCLSMLAMLYCKEKFYHIGQFFEYSAQVVAPILLFLVLNTSISIKRVLMLGNVSIALTFLCHGLYALDIYPQPGLFVDMVIRCFFVKEHVARVMLKVFGFLDLMVSLGIFFPRLIRLSLGYAAVWGGATALARTVSNFYLDFPLESLNQWLPETLYRMPHALLPLCMLIIDNKISHGKHIDGSKTLQNRSQRITL